jgi:hypothetical protein
MVKPAAVVLFVIGALAPAASGCHCSATPNLTQTGDIGPKGNHQLNCTCQVGTTGTCQTFGGAPPIITVPMQLCLPPDLNTAVGGEADASDMQFNTDVQNYCQSRVKDIISKLVPFLDPKACSQSDRCINAISCQPQIVMGGLDTVANPSCDGTCADVPCVLGKIPEGGPPVDGNLPDGFGNCDPDKVLPSGASTADPRFCKCTQATGCSGTTEKFCQVPPGNIDPPVLVSGFLTQRLSAPSTVTLDPNASNVKVHVHFTGGIGEPHDDTETSNVHGSVTLYGRPCPGSQCDMLMDMDLHPEDVTFHFSAVVCGVTCIQDVNVTASRISVMGGMGHTTVHIDSNGTATIPIGVLNLHAESIVSGVPNKSTERQIFDAPNAAPISFQVDFNNKTFTLPDVPFTFESGDGDAHMTLSGTLTNQPPNAVAGADQVLECTSFAGANATLDASRSSDPDGVLFGFEWWKGTALDSTALAGSGSTITVTQPVGGPVEYQLSVLDQFLDISVDSTHVKVQDTTPPTLTLAVDPSCLWPPDHSLVLYATGAGLTATAQDTCDPSPKVRIVNVQSNQPPNGGGSGNTSPDVFFSDTALCVRAEREGTVATPRQYTATVEATDFSGNTTTKSVTITVAHDQAGVKCPNVDRSRIVADGDPRCGTSH